MENIMDKLDTGIDPGRGQMEEEQVSISPYPDEARPLGSLSAPSGFIRVRSQLSPLPCEECMCAKIIIVTNHTWFLPQDIMLMQK